MSLKELLADRTYGPWARLVFGTAVAVSALCALYFMLTSLFVAEPASERVRFDLRAPLRIHVYDVPEDLFGVAEAACPPDMYYTEILLPKLARARRQHRASAASANAFWIPHRSTCLYHACLKRRAYVGTGAEATAEDAAVPAACKTEVAAALEAIWRHVIQTAPYWNASAGTDHVLVFAWDEASYLVGGHAIGAALRPAIHLTHYGSVAPTQAFHPHKDIVIPPFLNATVWSDAHRRSRQLRQRLSRGAGGRVAPWALFVGTVHDDPAYSAGVRQALRELARAPDTRLHFHQGHLPTYVQELSVATFALSPGGWVPWTPRPFEAMAVGAVPVLYSTDVRLPFERQVDYRSLVVKLAPEDVNATETLLALLPPADVQRLQAAGQAQWTKFFYFEDNPTGIRDAFTLAMRELAQRVGRFRPVGNERLHVRVLPP